MSYQLLGPYLVPAEGEKPVRSYHCTSYSSRLSNITAEGYLTVSSRRVVFRAEGESYTGKSILQSEVPIADVSGISSYKGAYFSLLHLLTALIVSFVGGAILSAIVGLLISLIFRDRSDPFSGSETVPIILIAVGAVAMIASSLIAWDNIWRSVVAATGAFLLSAAGGIGFAIDLVGGFFGGGPQGFGWVMVLGFLAGIYTMVCIARYSRREMMSLSIGSKGGSSTPIAISGSAFGLGHTAALKALTAEPASDAEKMIKELGAVINDIQALGDRGLEKWQARTAVPSQEQLR